MKLFKGTSRFLEVAFLVSFTSFLVLQFAASENIEVPAARPRRLKTVLSYSSTAVPPGGTTSDTRTSHSFRCQSGSVPALDRVMTDRVLDKQMLAMSTVLRTTVLLLNTHKFVNSVGIIGKDPFAKPVVSEHPCYPTLHVPPPSQAPSASAKPKLPPLSPHPPQTPTQTKSTPDHGPHSVALKRLVYMAAIIPAGLLVLGFVYIFVSWRKNSRAVKPLEAGSNRQQQTPSISGVRLFKRSELESACESFSNIVGSLSESLLYKGTLSSGIEIAVSFIKLDKALVRLSEEQFRKKIATLSKVNHRNFVNLLGCCEEGPLTKMLIFEYVPNGTLFEHLHAGEFVGLSWSARMRIAIGVAYCVDYLHQLDPPIVLKNLDTSLIYLTDDYAAKIADFELWSGTTEGGTVVGSSMSLLQEVPDEGRVVQKFGIVLLELLSGRDPNSEHSGPTEMWAWDPLEDEKPLRDVIDPELNSFPEDRAAAVFQLIKQCLNPKPEQVLSMKKVAARLKEITGISPQNAAPLGFELDIVSEGAGS